MPRFLSALALTLAFSLPAAAAPPNIILIVGDDQGWGDYGFMGHEHVRTPHLDRLAAAGRTFTHGYVPSSLCRPSLATMITGLFPHQHKITCNDPPLPRGPQFQKLRGEMVAYIEKVPTLPRLLEKHGYASFQAGKWWEGNACRCGGFTEGMTHGEPDKNGRHGDEGLTIGRQGLKPVFDFLDKAKKDDKPVFLWYAPMMPHSPHNPPDRLLAKYKDKTPSLHVAKYWAMCEWFDETVGDLLKKLADNGQAKDAVVIYLHDNGWIQDPNSPNYAPKSKRSPYDGGLRTPIIVNGFPKVTPGRVSELASSIDVAPTILAACGIEKPADMPGISLLDAKAVQGRKAVFGEVFEHNAIDIHSPAANLQYRWVVSGGWKLIVPKAPNVKGEAELYHVAVDPREERNVAKVNADKVAELGKMLDAWWTPK